MVIEKKMGEMASEIVTAVEVVDCKEMCSEIQLLIAAMVQLGIMNDF